VRYEESGAALRAVHSAFFLADQTISIGILGLRSKSLTKSNQGLLNDIVHSVGDALLSQLFQQSEWLEDRYKVDIRVRAIADSDTNQMYLHSTGFDGTSLQSARGGESNGKTQQILPFSMDQFVAHVKADHMPHWLIVDLSSSNSMVEYYPSWLASHIHVVSSNLNAACCRRPLFEDITRKTFQNEVIFDTEACLAIGVPVLSTLQNLLQTGDCVTKVELSFSTVLNTLLEAISNFIAKDINSQTEISFLECIQAVIGQYASRMSAQEIVDELTGYAAAKKVLLLARELGLNVDLNAAKVSL